MDEERKDEIGRKFLLSDQISLDECNEIEIQDLIFLIHSGKYFKEKEAFPNDHLDQRIKVFLNILKDKINDSEVLYIAYEKHTNYPYIDADDRIWMFSKEEYASGAEDYFLQQLLMLEMKKIGREDISKTFAEFHMLGLSKILIDNGQYHVEINRDDIFPPPDWSGTPDINIPVTNPYLQHAMIRFFQTMYSKNNDERKNQLLQAMEGQMLDEVVRAKYLLPMKLIEKEPSIPDEQGMKTLKEGTTIHFGILGAEEDSAWLPVFTDWIEFEKAYDKNVWSSNVVSYNDILTMSENMNGIVINCQGIPLRIDEKNKKMIAEYSRERNESHPKLPVKEITIQKDTRIMLGEPKDSPEKMIKAVRSYMKTQKGIKKAYLRLMVKDSEKSYLLIVDFEGSKEEKFNGIAAAALPYLNGMFLDMVGMDGWVNEVKDIDPFYIKKRFGLF